MAQWYYRNEPGSSTLNDEQSAALADSLNISPFLMNILRRRGLCSRKEIDSYLNPSLSGLVNPEMAADSRGSQLSRQSASGRQAARRLGRL